MWKKFLAVTALLFAAASFAAVEVNKATAEELDSVKGIGTAMAKKIVDERAKGAFQNWDDFVARVKGTGKGNAAKLSAAGLTVNGKERGEGAAETKANAAKPAASTKPVAAAPAATPTPASPPAATAKPDMKAAPMSATRASEPARK